MELVISEHEIIYLFGLGPERRNERAQIAKGELGKKRQCQMNIGMHIFGALVSPIFGTIVLVLYISTSVWVLCAPDAGRNSHFQRFFMQKSLKSKHFETKILKLLVIYNFS